MTIRISGLHAVPSVLTSLTQPIPPTTALTGGNTIFLMAAFSYWGVGLPASYVLGFPMGFGGAGIWWGLVIGLAVAAVLMSWRFWGVKLRESGAVQA